MVYVEKFGDADGSVGYKLMSLSSRKILNFSRLFALTYYQLV
jgi:hypothetical protein